MGNALLLGRRGSNTRNLERMLRVATGKSASKKRMTSMGLCMEIIVVGWHGPSVSRTCIIYLSTCIVLTNDRVLRCTRLHAPHLGFFLYKLT